MRVTIAMTMVMSTMFEHEYSNNIDKEAKYGDHEEALMLHLKNNNCMVIQRRRRLVMGSGGVGILWFVTYRLRFGWQNSNGNFMS